MMEDNVVNFTYLQTSKRTENALQYQVVNSTN
jgi:hypothetical protein